jgi:hypothetical protein
MVIKSFYRMSLGLGICLAFSQPSSAASFGCEGSAGSVIFESTLYGTAIGGILSGLYIWSRNDDKGYNQEKALANSTLTGALLGAGLGIFEISTRDCSAKRQTEMAGSFDLRIAALPSPATSSLITSAALSWSF